MTEPASQPSGTHYATFAEFWPFYLREHSRPRTRALHYVGTSLVVGIAAFAVVTGRWGMLLAMPVAGYFFAWLAHFTVEKNRPATFTYPLMEPRRRLPHVVAVADWAAGGGVAGGGGVLALCT